MRLKRLLVVLPLLLLIPIYLLYFGDVSTDRYFPLRKGNRWRYRVTAGHRTKGERHTQHLFTHVIKVIETRGRDRSRFARLEYKVSRGNKTWSKVFTAQAKGRTLRFIDWDGGPLSFWPHLLRSPLKPGALDPGSRRELQVLPNRGEAVGTPAETFRNCYRINGWLFPVTKDWWLCPGVGIVKYASENVHTTAWEEWVLTEYRVR